MRVVLPAPFAAHQPENLPLFHGQGGVIQGQSVARTGRVRSRVCKINSDMQVHLSFQRSAVAVFSEYGLSIGEKG